MPYSVALLKYPYATLTYKANAWLDPSVWQRGQRVLVPLRKTLCAGVLLGSVPAEKYPANLRALIWPLEKESLLPAELLNLAHDLALRQMVQEGQVLSCIFPAAIQIAHRKIRLFKSGKVQLFTLQYLASLAKEEELGKPQFFLRELGTAWLAGSAAIPAAAEDLASSEFCILQADPPWDVRPAAKRQIAILDLLLENGVLSRREILRKLGSEITPALQSLIKNGLVSIQHDEADSITATAEKLLPPPAKKDFVLSAEQQAALNALCTELDAAKACVHLLFGVTGSGKTAVYMEFVRACIVRGRSVFLLAPEVALACKLRRDAIQALPDIPLYFFHGYQNPHMRERTFRELAQKKEACLIIGTRSALFLPAFRLGAVILDEEHDSSFKQDDGLIYQTKELAWSRIRQNAGLLLLGSATPDLKTFHAAKESRIAISVLSHRAGGGTLPEVHLVNIKDADLENSLFAPESLYALKKTVARGDQAVILLNRRGFAPVMYCQDCGQTMRCPYCDIPMTYHRHSERLLCHYCGFTMPFPSPCPNCKGLHYYPMGQGTEHIEADLPFVLPPGCRILRLDRDSTRRSGKMEAILESFARREAQVLVGTQMLSKGHDFPDVTLAIILDADAGVNLPDYRAAERTFQLLLQSAGRAGRGEKPGHVLIQTRDPKFYCWDFVQRGDYEGFYNHEIALRKRRSYPPFIKLALIRISYPADWEDGQANLDAVETSLRKKNAHADVQLFGPIPPPLALLRGRRRFHFMLKAESWQAIRELYAAIGRVPQKMHISLDIDPVNMM